MMTPVVIEALQSKEKLKSLISQLKDEILEVNSLKNRREEQIENDIKRVMPSCEVYIFGSQFTGLATRDSDFDIYIDHDDQSYDEDLSQERQKVLLNTLKENLLMLESGFDVKMWFLEARVPIIKAIHKRTTVWCDIIVRSGLSVENSILTRQLLSSDFRVSWLVITINWWMRANNLMNEKNKFNNKFSSSGANWLVFFFLMNEQPNILKPVLDMKAGCQPHVVGGWDCRLNQNFYPDSHRTRQNKDKRIKLLTNFFKFYHTFNFENDVLCPLIGKAIPKRDFYSFNLPNAFRGYVNMIKRNPDQRLPTDCFICIQDPFELSHNITKDVNPDVFYNFKEFCYQSGQLLSQSR